MNWAAIMSNSTPRTTHPFGHPGAFLPHVVLAIIALGADVLKRMVLQAIKDLFGERKIAGAPAMAE
jgi:hypothetical protein